MTEGPEKSAFRDMDIIQSCSRCLMPCRFKEIPNVIGCKVHIKTVKGRVEVRGLPFTLKGLKTESEQPQEAIAIQNWRECKQ